MEKFNPIFSCSWMNVSGANSNVKLTCRADQEHVHVLRIAADGARGAAELERNEELVTSGLATCTYPSSSLMARTLVPPIAYSQVRNLLLKMDALPSELGPIIFSYWRDGYG